MSTISAEAFLKGFSAAWAAEQVGDGMATRSPYVDRCAWTLAMLSGEGLLAKVLRRIELPDARLEYRTEFYTVDALFVGGDDLFREGLSYPSCIHALIEHEFGNNIEEEMWKLIHWRAPLKVLIFYDWAGDEKTTASRRTWLGDKLSALAGMVKTVNKFHCEESSTTYLFLIGTRDTWNGNVTWCFATDQVLEPALVIRSDVVSGLVAGPQA